MCPGYRRGFLLWLSILGGAGSVGAVDFDQLVVDAEDEEGRSPLTDEEGFVVPLRGLEYDRDSHGSKGESEVGAGGDLCGELFDGCSDLILLSFTLSYAIVGHMFFLLAAGLPRKRDAEI